MNNKYKIAIPQVEKALLPSLDQVSAMLKTLMNAWMLGLLISRSHIY